MEKIYAVYFEADARNIARPCKTEEFPNIDSAMVAARINERGDGAENTFIVFADGVGASSDVVSVYESNMVSEYYVDINEFV